MFPGAIPCTDIRQCSLAIIPWRPSQMPLPHAIPPVLPADAHPSLWSRRAHPSAESLRRTWARPSWPQPSPSSARSCRAAPLHSGLPARPCFAIRWRRTARASGCQWRRRRPVPRGRIGVLRSSIAGPGGRIIKPTARVPLVVHGRSQSEARRHHDRP